MLISKADCFSNVSNAISAPTEKCDSPPSIANGALTLPPLTQYDNGSSVQYNCSEYHFLQGSEKIYCSEGQWTSPPVCIGRFDNIDKNLFFSVIHKIIEYLGS